MTRKEQILNEAVDYSSVEENFMEFYDCGDVWDDSDYIQKAFEEGAKWADEHPNLYSDEKYHTVKVKDLDELNRKAKVYDQIYRNRDSVNIYTKQELLDMGFAFDLNGNIRTPDECYESSVRHLEYRKHKFIDKACEWIEKYKHLHKELSFGSLSTDWNKFISEFRKAMEE